jgi:hypothetical protein
MAIELARTACLTKRGLGSLTEDQDHNMQIADNY